MHREIASALISSFYKSVAVPRPVTHSPPPTYEDITNSLFTTSTAPILETPLEIIKSKLTPHSLEFFEGILKLKIIGDVSSTKSFVLGDSDGSLGRIVLLAIQSGHIELKSEEGYNHLAFILNEETSLFQGENRYLKRNYTKYQSSSIISDALLKLYNECEFKTPTNQKLIFLGDIMHDRLTCNKHMTCLFVESLHNCGAIFILGNHDSIDATFPIFDKKKLVLVPEDVHFARFAFNQGFQITKTPKASPKKEHKFPKENKEVKKLVKAIEEESLMEQALTKNWEDFEHKNFYKCYYDKDCSYFYIHNGLEYKASKNLIATAFGSLPMENFKDITSFEKRINNINHIDPYFFTAFRPDNETLIESGFFSEGLFKNITLVHGHEGYFQVNSNIISLNPRTTKDLSWSLYPVGVCLGKK